MSSASTTASAPAAPIPAAPLPSYTSYLRTSIVVLQGPPADEPNCPICLDGWDTAPDIIELTTCHHVFHNGCLMEWFEISDENCTCPFCRTILFREDTDSLEDQRDRALESAYRVYWYVKEKGGEDAVKEDAANEDEYFGQYADWILRSAKELLDGPTGQFWNMDDITWPIWEVMIMDHFASQYAHDMSTAQWATFDAWRESSFRYRVEDQPLEEKDWDFIGPLATTDRAVWLEWYEDMVDVGSDDESDAEDRLGTKLGSKGDA